MCRIQLYDEMGECLTDCDWDPFNIMDRLGVKGLVIFLLSLWMEGHNNTLNSFNREE